jgi:hypothetical protein
MELGHSLSKKVEIGLSMALEQGLEHGTFSMG